MRLPLRGLGVVGYEAGASGSGRRNESAWDRILMLSVWLVDLDGIWVGLGIDMTDFQVCERGRARASGVE